MSLFSCLLHLALITVTRACIATSSPESVTTTTPTTTTTTTRICPVGWTYFSTTGYCYLVVTDSSFLTTWQQAENNCVSQGAHLASIHSAAEDQFLFNLAHTGSLLGIIIQPWIGLTQPTLTVALPGANCAATATFVWSDGTPFDYSDWFPLIQPACTGPLAGCTQMIVDVVPNPFNVVPAAGQWIQTTCLNFVGKWICKKLP